MFKNQILNNFLFTDPVEDRCKIHYSLELLSKDEENKKREEDHYITDIEDYKKDLYIYPVSQEVDPFKALDDK